MNLNGHSWTVVHYKEIDGHLYEVVYLFVIDGDRILKRVIKKERVYRRDLPFVEEVT